MRISDWSSDVCSSDLPFSVHGAARDVARAAGALFVADNRDIWAGNPYKWTAPFYKGFERGYEATSLAAADLVVAVSEGMSAHYRTAYPDLADRVLTVMNGVDAGTAATRYRRSEEHTSELQSLMRISYAVFCLKKKKRKQSTK